ncbi:MAG TPA: CapA family protein [Saprospiraceae bacterium]|nr:CapA family protein [Saprospiraceae bacterium]
MKKNYNPVRAYTRSGKLLASVLRGAYRIVSIFNKRLNGFPWPEHHEDPLNMTIGERLYLGYKYYFRAIVQEEVGSGLQMHFHSPTQGIFIPEGFQAETSATLSSGGDLMPYESITTGRCTELWREAGPFFFDADIVAANLETPIDCNEPLGLVPEIMLDDMYFNANEEMFTIFSGNGHYKNYDILSIANNHSLDKGEEGLIATMDFLENKNIAYCGGVKSAEQINELTWVEKNGIKCAFIGATFSLNAEEIETDNHYLVNLIPLNNKEPDITRLVNLSERAREQGADIIVLMLHMGCAYQAFPSATIVENMQQISRHTGADIILGNHPHHPQPLEFLEIIDPFDQQKKNALLIYSQGDFIAYDIYKWCHLPLLAKITLTKGMLNGKRRTFVSSLQLKLFYMYAHIKDNEIKSLRLLDFGRIRNQVPDYFDIETRKEFEEIKSFADEYLLPGNISKYLVG